MSFCGRDDGQGGVAMFELNSEFGTKTRDVAQTRGRGGACEIRVSDGGDADSESMANGAGSIGWHRGWTVGALECETVKQGTHFRKDAHEMFDKMKL